MNHTLLRHAAILAILVCCTNSFAQNTTRLLNDTLVGKTIEIQGQSPAPYQLPPDSLGLILLAGKKAEIINVQNQNASLVNNNSRQVFSRVAGIQVWESEGSGIQINVASRGLNPNRSWEFNVRQNGYDISSDVFGYPEAYYNPPMEAVERIEIIRGAASLQFGPQFGGLLNYVLAEPDGPNPLSAKVQLTGGSFGLFSIYNAIRFKKGKWSISAYDHYRRADGWRQNSGYEVNNAHLKVQFAATKKLLLTAEATVMHYLAQQAGGLTDSLFALNPRQSLRSRNWFQVPWIIPTLTANYRFNANTQAELKIFGLLAERNSVGFTSDILVADIPSATTGLYSNRRVDRDFYKNLGAELRVKKAFNLFKKQHVLAVGARVYNGNTFRKQNGKGSANSDFDLELVPNAVFNRDMRFSTFNMAAFAENAFYIGKKFSITPGLRIESIQQESAGLFGINSTGEAINWNPPAKQQTRFLAGVSTAYKHNESFGIYGGITSNFRPVLFSDLLPPATTDTIDANLSDASGYNAEFGIRGQRKNWLVYDFSVFYLYYANRIGTLALPTASGGTRQLRTNVGDAVSKGVEYLIEVSPVKAICKTNYKNWDWSMFVCGTFLDARYTRLPKTSVKNNQITTTDLTGNRLEHAPELILRTGTTFRVKTISISLQVSHTGDVFATADNTEKPSLNGNDGLIPAYTVADLNLGWEIANKYSIKAGITNLTNATYFTRRAGGYPGPGLLPADARSAWLSFGIKW